ncbi:hypothetical protein D3C81_1321570 [compost metagenome]
MIHTAMFTVIFLFLSITCNFGIHHHIHIHLIQAHLHAHIIEIPIHLHHIVHHLHAFKIFKAGKWRNQLFDAISDKITRRLRSIFCCCHEFVSCTFIWDCYNDIISLRYGNH